MDVYFIRHGQTNGNLAFRHQHPDTPLNEQGAEQVKSVLQTISELNPTHIITSSQLRAVETARILSSASDVIPETSKDFEELIRPPRLVGVRLVGFTTFVYVVSWFFGGIHAGGESYAEFLERIKRARQHLESLPAEARVLVVSHAIFTNIFIEHLCLDKPMSFFQAVKSFYHIFRLRNASIVHLKYTKVENLCGWQVLRR